MRFLTLTYRKFGPFDRVELDLSNGKHGLHVIYGPNEAGKTTALRGLGFLLFGFPHNTCDDFRHKHTEQRVGATFLGPDGCRLSCLRRRGNKNTLRLDDDKTPIAEEELRRLLGGINSEQFDMMFGLSHDRLVAGGQAIAEGQGEIGAALFEAGTGMAGLRRLDRRLTEQLGALYKPRGQNQTIAVTLRQYKESQDRLKQVTLRIEAWTAQEEALRQALTLKKQLEEERNRNRQEIGLANAFRAALPAIGALQDQSEALKPLRSAALLRTDFAEDLRSVVEKLLLVNGNLNKAREDLQCLNDELLKLNVPNELLVEETGIEQMERDLGMGLKAWRDRVDLHARKREHQGNARRILKNHFGRERLEEAEQLRLSPADTERIRRLGEARQSLLDAVAGAADRLAKLQKEIKEKESLLNHSSALPDGSTVKAQVQAWMREGPLEKNLREVDQQLGVDIQKAQAGLKRLSFCWKGNLEQVPDLAVPLPATVQFYQQMLQGLDEQVRDRDRRLQECETKLRQLDDQTDTLLREGFIPSEDELRQQRADRDVGLGLVRSEWLGTGAEPLALRQFVERHASGRHVLDAVETSVRSCDDVSDALRAEAERVTRLAACRAEREAAHRTHVQLSQELQELKNSRKRYEDEWLGAWRPSGITPRTPFEMREWLQELATVRQSADSVSAATIASVQLRDRIEEGKRCIRDAFVLPAGEDDWSLAQLLELAGQRLEAAEKERRRREQLEEKIRELKHQRGNTELDQAQAQQRLTDWTHEWAEAVRVINLSARDEPTTASRYLDQRDEMFRELREAETLELRIKGIDRDREEFLAKLTALRNRLDGAARSPSTVESAATDVQDLRRRLNAARDLRTRCELLEEKRGKSEAHLRELEDQSRQLVARRETFRQEAGVNDAADIVAAVQRSEERRRLEERMEEERRRLRELARGQPLEAFIEEALAAREALDARLQALETRVGPLDEEINQQVAVEVAAGQKLSEWRRASAEAAECRQLSEHLLATLREQVTDFAVLHLAREVLRRALEGFRQKNQGTLLGRAEQFFRTLTVGAFAGLEVEDNENAQPVLLAVRASPEERVGIDGLSDGTRDQLFLSLRLAGIEQHLKTRPPLPLVVDDVMVRYDDRRALAALHCLVELSAHTQVLFFTHHEHLVDLARKSLPGECLFCHSLGS